MGHSHAVRFEVSKYVVLKERLLVSSPTLTEYTLLDTLEGITDLHEMIAAVIRSALVDEPYIGPSLPYRRYARSGFRVSSRARQEGPTGTGGHDRGRTRKLEQPDFTASARSGSPPLVVLAEEIIPEGCWLPQPSKLDRQAIPGLSSSAASRSRERNG